MLSKKMLGNSKKAKALQVLEFQFFFSQCSVDFRQGGKKNQGIMTRWLIS